MVLELIIGLVFLAVIFFVGKIFLSENKEPAIVYETWTEEDGKAVEQAVQELQDGIKMLKNKSSEPLKTLKKKAVKAGVSKVNKVVKKVSKKK